MTSGPPQRVGPVAQLPPLLAELGVSVETAFAGSGIAPEQLQPEARLPYAAIAALLEGSARHARCPHLGLLLGARCDHRALGPIGDMMACAATLGEAFHDYVGLQVGYSRGAVVYLQLSGDETLIGYGLYDAGASLGRQIHDLVLAMGCNMVRALSAGRVQPLRALQCVRPPDNPALYRSILKAQVSFDQEQTAIAVSGHDMTQPLPDADPARRLALRAAIQKMVSGDLEDVAAQVRHALRPRLMLDEADRVSVAHALRLEPRTLARRLARAGTSFEAIKDEVRFTVARELLALTCLPVSRIAEALSYGAISSFDHAFQRWSGLSPTRWRAEHQTQGEQA